MGQGIGRVAHHLTAALACLRAAVAMLLLLLTLSCSSDDKDKTPCEPVALYGPPPCDSDQDCVNWNGEGWYCDKDNSFDDGCGGTSTWAICRQSATTDAGPAADAGPGTDACEPVALYGPKPCNDDAECVADNGDGWYCDKDNVYGDGCGGTSTWPICRPGETKTDAGAPDGPCAPVALYGPPPCGSDEDCVNWYGEGWTCNKDNSFDDGCGGTSTWPMCEQKSSS